MPISVKEKVRLRGEAMHLKEVLRIGKAGASPGVLAQLDACLLKTPLIKIRIEESDRPRRHAIVAELAERTGAELIGETGRTAVLWRQREAPPEPETPPA